MALPVNRHRALTKAQAKLNGGIVDGYPAATEIAHTCNNEAINSVNAAGTGVVALIKADSSDNPTIPGTLALSDTVTVATNKKLQFRDTGLFIQSAADGKLTISADGTGADDITLSGTTTASDDITLAAGKALVYAAGSSKVLTEVVTISAADIVSTSAGKFGHAAGQILVADPGAGKVIELISAVLSFTYSTAQYTAGGNITVNSNGGSALTGLVSAANSVGAAADKIVQFVPLSTAGNALTANKGLNLVAAAAFTQPGTAAGTIKVFVTYRVHTL